MTDIVLRLTRGSVLSGRITDENGEPAFGVAVRVLQARVQFGERTFVPGRGPDNLRRHRRPRRVSHLRTAARRVSGDRASPRTTPVKCAR